MASKRKTVVRYGFLGCLGLVGVAAVAVGVLLAVAWFQVRGEQIASDELVREEPVDRLAIEAVALARVLLDIKDAEVVVSSGPAGSAPRIEATYDSRYFALEQKPSTDPGAPETWHIWFRRVHGSGLAMHWAHQIVGATRPEIRLWLPEEMPLALHGNLSGGLVQAELGGLLLTEVDIELSGGGLKLDFAEVTEPIERLRIDVRQAGIEINNVGNASPRELTFDVVMSSAEIDLGGAWRRDAEIDLESKLARGVLQLPRDVATEGLSSSGLTAQESELPRPTLSFIVDQETGGLKIKR